MEFRFLDLPREIRNGVYRIHFRNIQIFVSCENPHICRAPKASEVELLGWKRSTGTYMNLTLVSKQIRREAISEFLKHAIFDIRGFHTMQDQPPLHWHRDMPPQWQIQHFIDCLSQVHRIRINVFNLRASELLQPPRKLGSTTGFKVGAFTNGVLKEVVLFDRIWNNTKSEVLEIAERLSESQDIKNIHRLVTEGQRLVIFLVLDISFYPTGGRVSNHRHKVKVRIEDGEATILTQPQYPKAKDVMKMYMQLVGLTMDSTSRWKVARK